MHAADGSMKSVLHAAAGPMKSVMHAADGSMKSVLTKYIVLDAEGKEKFCSFFVISSFCLNPLKCMLTVL